MINFFRNLFGTSLKSKVMKKIEARIENTQRNFDLEVKRLREIKSDTIDNVLDEANEKIKDAKFQYKSKKASLEEQHISNLLGKIL